jgi:hypothetical protein
MLEHEVWSWERAKGSNERIREGENLLHPVRPPGEQRPGDSTMSDPELAALEREAVALQPMGPFLEVGIYHGRTSCLLGQIGTTVCVDWLKGNVELAPPERRGDTGWSREHQLRFLLPNLRRYPSTRQNIILLEGSSTDVLPLLRNQTFSLALIDGDKREESVYADIALAWPLVLPGGTLFLDDYYASVYDAIEDYGTVKRAWNRFAEERGLEELSVDLIGYQPPDYGSTPKLARIRKPLGSDIPSAAART